jgi:cellulose synthase/poly-beta-1,6-N-acetylglucosamine synthase-like glycosyltransferase
MTSVNKCLTVRGRVIVLGYGDCAPSVPARALCARTHQTGRTGEKLRLSVIIPVFNELAFIEELLLRVQDSMLAEEIIVVDDGSTDGTRQLLRGLQERTIQRRSK